MAVVGWGTNALCTLPEIKSTSQAINAWVGGDVEGARGVEEMGLEVAEVASLVGEEETAQEEAGEEEVVVTDRPLQVRGPREATHEVEGEAAAVRDYLDGNKANILDDPGFPHEEEVFDRQVQPTDGAFSRHLHMDVPCLFGGLLIPPQSFSTFREFLDAHEEEQPALFEENNQGEQMHIGGVDILFQQVIQGLPPYALRQRVDEGERGGRQVNRRVILGASLTRYEGARFA
uniref:Uncharacterized protein n=1 Tax=Chromera velia CCMP2878 TaxID=1169474 RepID=A0A0G4HFZ1_9ALVE|eukprot:Cvel_27199.t1-p1 / transcript=Cvel_27199.t1 / gene=Cvel_27199 / organism=Chromera_velia_CCMP2878 / gene_product=hypothetical protein / transcript_product=hypothetical protein / location=Cvel_scaffold3358:12588-13405(-) / protein_length=231 / sequence_SO=supercontig / SO=protein_coding / is_pseudo=false